MEGKTGYILPAPDVRSSPLFRSPGGVMKSWFVLMLIGLCWGCQDDSITTAYGKNALRREKAEPAAQPDVKPAETEEYEPPLTPRFETEDEPETKESPDPEEKGFVREIATAPSPSFSKQVDKWIVTKDGSRVAANQIVVKYKDTCTEEKALARLAKAKAKKIGTIVELRLLQVEVKAETEKALDEWIVKLKKVECVEDAMRNIEVTP